MKEKHEPIDFRNHRYSSIDMARETGMSSEGLRFYERKGILQVDKDEKNGYRTYPIMKVPMSECINAGAIIVGDTLPVFEYVSLDGTDSTFYYCFQLTDIFGETELSDFIEFEM